MDNQILSHFQNLIRPGHLVMKTERGWGERKELTCAKTETSQLRGRQGVFVARRFYKAAFIMALRWLPLIRRGANPELSPAAS